jgi:general secretion pathway protein N
MINALRPTGALIAALALWAIGLLVLGVAGLGGRVGPHPDDSRLAPPLPQVNLIAMEPRLRALVDYPEIGTRPLLSPDRRPAPVVAAAGDGDAPLEATLTSVLIAGNVRLAIVAKKDDPAAYRVRLGDALEGTGWRLVELQPRLAVFEGPQGRRELPLRVFDGTGGEMPAPSGAPAGAAPPPPPLAQTPPSPPAGEEAPAMTPEQQVEAIRRRIEARRAARAQEGAEERASMERDKQVE